MDWEAILSRNPTGFIQSVSPWLYPPAARESLLHAPSGQGLTADSARADQPGMSGPPAVTPASSGHVSGQVEGGSDQTDANVQGECTV